MTVAALAVANALGQATIADTAHFWAAPFEEESEFGGLGLPSPFPKDAARLRVKGAASPRESTTLAVIATDAALSKAQAKRLAIMAHDGFARALWPAHTPHDGDIVFALATGARAASRSRRPHRTRRRRGGVHGPRHRPRRLRSAERRRRPRAELARAVRPVNAGRLKRGGVVSGGRYAFPNLSTPKGDGSANGLSPAIISAASRPLAGPSVKPRWPWPKSRNSPGWRGAQPITGMRVGEAGTASHPRLVHRLAEREELAGERQHAAELDRRRRRIARRELDSRGHPHPAFHRRDDEAVLDIDHRPRERGVALGLEVPVVAALDRKRQVVAKRPEHVHRPRPEGDDGDRRDHEAIGRVDGPRLIVVAGAWLHRR